MGCTSEEVAYPAKKDMYCYLYLQYLQCMPGVLLYAICVQYIYVVMHTRVAPTLG